MTARDVSVRTTALALRLLALLFYAGGAIAIIVNGLFVADYVQSRRMPPKGVLAPMVSYALLTIGLPMFLGWLLSGMARKIQRRDVTGS